MNISIIYCLNLNGTKIKGNHKAKNAVNFRKHLFSLYSLEKNAVPSKPMFQYRILDVEKIPIGFIY